ncbi:hypothetical protein [Brenneria rubrifaciens]|uniref:Uncharacterized protein n=1 Tax=Brenneria rubrifaciens TaxID=55213 RepID=A0A4P8QN12_9GAMM|nr:hypothetical protein [Brenneria rubrifaciens]QCR08341.1 hypothetical protein EH207_07325 [Brenneria rubrifaciens]
MLTIFQRFTARATHSQTKRPAQAATHAYCRESEFCFFNHSATLPFDQVNECYNDRLRQEPKSGSR